MAEFKAGAQAPPLILLPLDDILEEEEDKYFPSQDVHAQLVLMVDESALEHRTSLLDVTPLSSPKDVPSNQVERGGHAPPVLQPS